MLANLIDVDHASALEREDEEHVQDVEGNRGHCEKVEREDSSEVRAKELALMSLTAGLPGRRGPVAM